MIIIATFVLAFGVSLQAIIFPSNQFSSRILIDILNIAYWPIYGEISILSAINNETLMKSADLLIKFGVNIHHLNNNQ